MEIALSENDKLLVTKLHASGADIRQARAYAFEIMKKNWFRMPWSRGKGYFHQGAYVTALVVSYGRPFATGRGGYRFPSKLIPYSQQELELHQRLLKQRSKIYAHSDLDHWNIRPFKEDENYFETIIVGQPFHVLEREDVELFLRMTSKLVDSIHGRYSQILKQYGSGNFVYF
jgi:hypothetical protein